MTAPGFCATATARAVSGSKSAVMAAAGAAVGVALWMGLTMALTPLSFFALGTGPFVAALISLIMLWRTETHLCSAPMWAQRRKAAFWIGVFSVLVYVCVGVAIEIPQLILFWPAG